MSGDPSPPDGPERRPPPPGPAWNPPDPFSQPSQDASRGAELRPMKLGEMVDRSIKLYQANFATLAGVVAVIIVPWSLLVFAVERVDTGAAGFLSVAGGFAINPIVSGAIAWAAAELYLGRRPTVSHTYRYVGERVGPVIGVSILTGLAIMVGFVLLVIPGLILLARLFAATIAVVIEDRRVGPAMRRSNDLVTGDTGRVLGYLVVIGIVVFVGTMIFGVIGTVVDSAALRLVVDIIGSVIFTPLNAVFGVLLYFDLRIRKEAFDLEVMARELTDGT